MTTPFPAELLKEILENLRQPEKLSTHPWVDSQVVKTYTAAHPEAENQPDGVRLIATLVALFRAWMPVSPPRRGKRLDSRWGEFGILAATYFAPLVYRKPYPRSLRDAWREIDQAILLFVNNSEESPGEEQKSRYTLVGNETEIAPNSTISDWHRKGLERFSAFILDRDKNPDLPTLIAIPPGKKTTNQSMKKFSALIKYLILALLLGEVLLTGIKFIKLYQTATALRQDIRAFEQIKLSLDAPQNIEAAGPILDNFHKHVDSLDKEVRPYLGIAAALSWIPKFGGDLANAEPLLDMALALSDTAEQAYQGALPLAIALSSNTDHSLNDILGELIVAEPKFTSALESLEQAQAARERVDLDVLSPGINQTLVAILDPKMSQIRELLLVASAGSKLAGASNEDPKTYLILLQNEDELRATGGFIAAVGSIVLYDGQMVDTSFEDSYDVDSFDKPYPPAPWQLERYMESEILMLRDTSWFADFPSTADWAEYLYAYTRARSVYGVIAIDQQAVIRVLKVIGPVTVEGVDEPISADNVVSYWRESKAPPPGVDKTNWDRKAFITQLGNPLLKKMLSGKGFSWNTLAKTIQGALDEKHILLVIDDPATAQVVAQHHWNGDILAGNGDFLMVIDSNLGFDKVNAQVDEGISYRINLEDLTRPKSKVTVRQVNETSGDISCDRSQANNLVSPEDTYYRLNHCYWDYLRIYAPSGTRLLQATPHSVPAEWTTRNEFVPARIDILDEKINGTQSFGTFFVVPAGQSLETSFEFELPGSILVREETAGQYTYYLRIQKQPGTLKIPITIAIVLPQNSSILMTPPDAVIANDEITITTNLQRDVEITITFQVQ